MGKGSWRDGAPAGGWPCQRSTARALGATEGPPPALTQRGSWARGPQAERAARELGGTISAWASPRELGVPLPLGARGLSSDTGSSPQALGSTLTSGPEGSPAPSPRTAPGGPVGKPPRPSGSERSGRLQMGHQQPGVWGEARLRPEGLTDGVLRGQAPPGTCPLQGAAHGHL